MGGISDSAGSRMNDSGNEGEKLEICVK